MSVATVLEQVLGGQLPVAIIAYDGSRAGPPDATTTVVVRSPDAIRRMVTAPGELGLARAYVAGDLELEGDVFEALGLHEHFTNLRPHPRDLAALAKLVGASGLRPLPPPPEEVRLHGRRHSKRRDAAAISHHYDVPTRFFELVLGPSMTYSCAVFADESTSLEDAQAAKHELVCQKLALRPGMRLLDVGCGWGSMVMHAAQHHGVEAVGVTLSHEQAVAATKRVADAGLADRVQIREQDYRDVDDGPFDAISSIGMFEHVGAEQLGHYFHQLHTLVRPGGRLLNHGISRPRSPRRYRPRIGQRTFIGRYVFPDGELCDVGSVITAMQVAGFEARHLESLREHYGRTLRHWVANLEREWDEAVAEARTGRARVWRLYMAASAINFEVAGISVHQVLGVRPHPGGASDFPLRPSY
jgi:cyclopropane-fatty-acyl-phospholipid synthase